MNAGTRNVYNSKQPIKTVADLKGLKIRMMGNPVFVDTMNALGGNGVAMGFDQLISALQTGVVDGAENNEPSYVTRPALPLRQVLLADRPPDHSRRSWCSRSGAGTGLVQGRPGLITKSRQGGAAGAAQALVRDGAEVDRRR